MRYLLGVDFGGGSSKATLLCEDGTVVATASAEYPTYYLQEGFVEQKPDDWIEAACRNINDVINESNVDAKDIIAVCFDAATHTAVLMDENFNVIRNSIYWTDTRSMNEVLYLKENYEEIIDRQVLHKPSTIWTLPELMWIKNNEKETWKKVRKILFAKDYVRHYFTGDYVTDYIEAEGSMMFDINTLSWSKELCDILDIDVNMLPEIKKPTDIVGYVKREATEKTLLCEGTPIICGTTDTVMEIFASGAVNKGQMTVKMATAGRICVISDEPFPDVNMINYSHIQEGLYYPGTATKSCAASYRWFRDVFGGDYKELDSLAEKIEIGANGLVFHPYLNGELTPYNNPDLCADFVGVRSYHNKAHFARAVLEGVVMSMCDCMRTLENFNIQHDEKAILIGGGAKSSLWRRMLCEALGVEGIIMKHSDSSFGGAMLAGVAAGVFDSPEQAVKICNTVVEVIYPCRANTEKYDKLFRKYKRIQEALESVYNGEF